MAPGRLVFALGVVAVLGWLVTSPGGISARVDGLYNRVTQAIHGATIDPGLARATKFFNTRYESTGQYPFLTEADLRRDVSVDWGVGVNITYCNSRAMVLSAISGGGTQSRLLLDGEERGDVSGRVGCPTDLARPAPWS